jgi:IS30 family transposase
MRVSHETIYRGLFIQARGVLKKELMDHLRSKRCMRRSRHASEHGQSRADRRCRDTAVVVAALSRHVRKLPATRRRSLTWDRGLEMAKHKEFTVATDVKVYFGDPQSPWQGGTNKNTNLLLRQYFLKGTDLSGYSQAQLDQVSLRLNQRPRKTLGFQAPASKLQASVAATV